MSDLEKKWNNLKISNDYLFKKIMQDKNIAKKAVELLIGKEVIEVLEVIEEKFIDVKYASKSIRLDVYLKDVDKVCNVEMQLNNVDDLIKRGRIYQSMIDSDIFLKGYNYTELIDSYVVFICCFDLFGNGLSKNSFVYKNEQTNELLNDGTYRIYYNTKGYENEEDESLREFLKFVNGEDSDDSFVNELKSKIEDVKGNEKWRADYMKYEFDKMCYAKKNFTEGKEIGLEKGKEIGKKEGSKDQQIKIAKNLINFLDDKVVADNTNLSIEEVKNLRKSA